MAAEKTRERRGEERRGYARETSVTVFSV